MADLESKSTADECKNVVVVEQMQSECNHCEARFKSQIECLQKEIEEHVKTIVDLKKENEELRLALKQFEETKKTVATISSKAKRSEDSPMDDSPFLITIQNRMQDPILGFRKRAHLDSRSDENESPTTFGLPFRRPDSQRTPLSFQNKRYRLFTTNMNAMNIAAGGSKSESTIRTPESELNIMKAVQKADQDSNLIGDFTKPYALPLVHNSKHEDLKTISAETLAAVIRGEFRDQIFEYSIIDCRYPYEYEGGHIKGAKNIYLREHICEEFFNENKLSVDNGKRSVIIFHCEFSSERAPTMYRFLRSKDREVNTYPNLFHPEVYLLHGGYKSFYEKFKELCDPQQYLPMSSSDHKHLLRAFKSKSKSWTCERKAEIVASNCDSLQKQLP
ncbi:M-phase inducer phosphatase 1-B-like protein [Dinothrombium tinctorium]|uniref:M-phase inducer phosphatase n=1 Tax=Dinothrombium tinctorium TaxID=1965070 RepID=A0A443QQ14_9ACAR|nr:M-phase inducer phosphatase 1-B-like protein [Dinothrombium tinctorium]RWS05125.1 M-phase inducer phosphatase 1-B-like protein [Dinothrombium tinctorium]